MTLRGSTSVEDVPVLPTAHQRETVACPGDAAVLQPRNRAAKRASLERQTWWWLEVDEQRDAGIT
jgi:hypothetical protein